MGGGPNRNSPFCSSVPGSRLPGARASEWPPFSPPPRPWPPSASTSANALVIHPIWDSSVTSNANKASIEADFNAVAAVFEADFSNPVTINVGVGWGEVNGTALGSSALGESEDMGMSFSYAQLSSDLRSFSSRNPSDTVLAQAVTHLPSTAP